MRTIFLLPMPVRHFIDVPDLSQEELFSVLKRAHQIDAEFEADDVTGTDLLHHRTVGFVNEMESARTAGSILNAAKFHDGGYMEFGKGAHKTETGGIRESTISLLRTASAVRCRIVVARIANQEMLEAAKRNAKGTSFVNGLTKGKAHPLQAMADVFGFQKAFAQRGIEVEKPKIVFSGRGDNNVTISQAKAAMMMGWDWVHTGPMNDFQIPEEDWNDIKKLEKRYGGSVTFEPNPHLAVADAHGIYTDIPISMGEKDDVDLIERVQMKLPPYQVNPALMGAASKEVLYGHCLPKMEGSKGVTEVTDEVHDGPNSIIWEIVNGRTATTAALFELLLEKD